MQIKKFPKVAVVATKLNFFIIPTESGTIIKPFTLKHFQVTYMLHKAGSWTINVYFQSILFIFNFFFNFPESRKKKAGGFFLFLVHLQVTWSVSHTSTCSKLWKAWELPCLFHLSSGEVKWNGPFLDRRRAFPLHGEVMENSLKLLWILVVYRGFLYPYKWGRWWNFRFRSPSWMTAFPLLVTSLGLQSVMSSSKMAARSGRSAIFLLNRCPKTLPRSWMTSFPAPPSSI